MTGVYVDTADNVASADAVGCTGVRVLEVPAKARRVDVAFGRRHETGHGLGGVEIISGKPRKSMGVVMEYVLTAGRFVMLAD